MLQPGKRYRTADNDMAPSKRVSGSNDTRLSIAAPISPSPIVDFDVDLDPGPSEPARDHMNLTDTEQICYGAASFLFFMLITFN